MAARTKRIRADRRAEADQLFVQDQPKHAAEGFGVRLVHRFEDDLPQPFLALRSQKQIFNELPALGIVG